MPSNFWPSFWPTVKLSIAILLALVFRPMLASWGLYPPLSNLLGFLIPALVTQFCSEYLFARPKLTTEWATKSSSTEKSSKFKQDRVAWPEGDTIWIGEIHAEMDAGGLLFRKILEQKNIFLDVHFGLVDSNGFELTIDKCSSHYNTNKDAMGIFRLYETSRHKYSGFAKFSLKKKVEVENTSRDVELEVLWNNIPATKFIVLKKSNFKKIDGSSQTRV